MPLQTTEHSISSRTLSSRPLPRSRGAILAALTALLWTSALGAVEPVASVDVEKRFALRSYLSAGQEVLVDVHLDQLILKTDESAQAEDLIIPLEELLAKANAALGTNAQLTAAPRKIRPEGLFHAVLNEALPRSLLAGMARELMANRNITSVYPVLRRGTGRAFYDDRLVITSAPGQLDAVLEKSLQRSDGILLRKSRVPDTALIRIGPALGEDAVDASRVLSQIAGVTSAEPNLYRELEPLALSDDPLLANQWHLYRDESSQVPGTAHIDAVNAWEVTRGSPTVVVAVFDSGTEITHEDLAPNIVGGFDAVDNDDDPSAECSNSQDGRDYSSECPDNRPFRESHGTSVSGTIAAKGDNGMGLSGVCPDCSLMPVRLLGGYASSSLSIAEAFVRAVEEGAWIINNSWGPGASIYFPLSRSEHDAFEYARTKGRDGLGTVILFAAGNDTANVALDSYAATHLTMAVAASTNLDDFALYSNYGRQIDVAAPSAGGTVQADNYGIYTTDVTGDEGYAAGDYNPSFSGTSAASPVAAGVAALVLSLNPQLTSEQVRLALTSTAAKIAADQVNWVEVIGQDLNELFQYDERGHSIGFGFGRVDARKAVDYAQNPSLNGDFCSAEGCEVCSPQGRCQTRCDVQADCPDGTTCRGGSCAIPSPRRTDVGEACSSDCTWCAEALDTQFQLMDICTTTCSSDTECPAGFDCRLTEYGGPSICAPGSTNAGEPQDTFNCFSGTFGTQLVVAGDDGQKYCSDLCFSDGAGACPHGFSCGWAACECTQPTNRGCYEYTCEEVMMNQSNLGEVCFPEPNHGVRCRGDVDCKVGDYCDDGACRVDDRDGCAICGACTSNEECGERGLCYGLRNADVGQCTRVCQDDGDCPGDSTCKEVNTGWRSFKFCTAPTAPGDEICTSEYQCNVACRADVPCDGGEVCERGTCVPAPATETDSSDDNEGGNDADAGMIASCQSTRSSGGFWVGMLALLCIRLRRGRAGDNNTRAARL